MTEPRPSEFSKAAKDSMAGQPDAQVRDRVLACIREYGPSTTDEIEVRTGLKHQTASPSVLALRTEGVLAYRGNRLTRSKRWAAVWGIAEPGEADAQPPVETAVSVDPVGSGGTQASMFEVVPEPVKPSLRPSDYACGKVVSRGPAGSKVKEPCLNPFTEIKDGLMDGRYVEGWCSSHHWQIGSLRRADGLPIGYGTMLTTPKTTKLRRVRKRK